MICEQGDSSVLRRCSSRNKKHKPCTLMNGCPEPYVICQSDDPLGLDTHSPHVTRLVPLGICKPDPKRGFPLISQNIQHFSSLLRMVLQENERGNEIWFSSCWKACWYNAIGLAGKQNGQHQLLWEHPQLYAAEVPSFLPSGLFFPYFNCVHTRAYKSPLFRVPVSNGRHRPTVLFYSVFLVEKAKIFIVK